MLVMQVALFFSLLENAAKIMFGSIAVLSVGFVLHAHTGMFFGGALYSRSSSVAPPPNPIHPRAPPTASHLAIWRLAEEVEHRLSYRYR